MTEQFSNRARTTLAGGINNVTTTVIVASAALFPTSGTFRLAVEDEIMLVTAVSGTTFTVTRGAEGTTPAAHANGTAVAQVITAGAIAQLKTDIVAVGSGNPQVRAVIVSDLGSAPTGSVAASVSDSVTLADGDLVLLVGMTTNPQYNGVMQYNSSGAWTFPTNYSLGTTVKPGFVVQVGAEGNNYGRTKWDLGNTSDVTIGTTATTWYQQTFSYNRRRLPYVPSDPSALRLWWRLDQDTSNLVNEIVANGTHQFIVTDGGSRGVLQAMPDDMSTLGTGGLQGSGAGSPNTLYCATADTAFQPTSGTAFVLNCWLQLGPYGGTGVTHLVGFQHGSTTVVRLGFSGQTVSSPPKVSGSLRVNGTLYTATGNTTLRYGERYLLSLSLSSGDSGLRVLVNGYEDGYTATTPGGTVTWAPSSGTRRWYLFNDPSNAIPSTFAHGVLEEVRVFNNYLLPIVAERAEYMRGIGSSGRT